MIAPLNGQFKQLERSRNELLQRLATYTLAQLQFRPSPVAWSIIEVVHHLVLAEYYATAYIEKKLSNTTAVQTLSTGARFRSWLLTLAMRSPFRFKAPSTRVLPDASVTPTQVLAQWEELRQKWAALLETAKPEHLHLALYRHPVAGLLTLSQAITFVQEHFNHHLQQFQRIIAAPDFPAPIATSSRDHYAAQ